MGQTVPSFNLFVLQFKKTIVVFQMSISNFSNHEVLWREKNW